jgi:hypothetical protein
VVQWFLNHLQNQTSAAIAWLETPFALKWLAKDSGTNFYSVAKAWNES